MANSEFDPNPYSAPEAELQPALDIPIDRTLQIAEFWPRFLGFLIDHVVLYALMYFLVLVAGCVMLQVMQSYDLGDEMLDLRHFFLITIFAINPVYFAILESSNWQATVGKRVMGLKVVDIQGQRLTFWSSCWRSLCRQLSYLSLLTGFFLPILSKKRQTLHDLLAGCVVIKE